MLTRKDGTPITPDSLTDEDVALSPWNVLEYLDSEEEIKGFLEGVVEEGGDDASISRSLVKAAQARIINQLAKETGTDRQALCDMFLEATDGDEAPATSHDVVVKIAKAFDVPVPV
jgi:probable addiction module antidote protein